MGFTSYSATHYVNMQSLRKSSDSYAGYNLLRTVHCPAAIIVAQLEAPCGRSSVYYSCLCQAMALCNHLLGGCQ